MTVAADRLDHEGYTITWADRRHAEAFVALHRDVFGTWEPRGRAQFDWKYADNPFVDDLPVVVVEDDTGDLVGARGYFVLPVMVGDEEVLAFQSSDLMVHPDHRRRGLFRKMNELGLSTAAGGEAFFFSFPGAAARAGYEADGWAGVDNPVYLRPLAWEPERVTATADLLKLAGSRGLAAALGALDRLAGVGVDYEVRELSDPSPAFLADLYRQHVPDGIHARRTEQLYEWRLAEPLQPHRVYVAERDGTVAAAVLVSEWDGKGQVRDVLPYDAPGSAVAAVLRTVAAEFTDADVLRAWKPAALDRSVLLAAGLLPESVLPFVSASDDLVTRGGPSSSGGPDPTAPGDWDIHLLERDY